MRTQVSWGVDLASEHERYLTEEVFKQPVIVYNYPKEIKARPVPLSTRTLASCLSSTKPRVLCWPRRY